MACCNKRQEVESEGVLNEGNQLSQSHKSKEKQEKSLIIIVNQKESTDVQPFSHGISTEKKSNVTTPLKNGKHQDGQWKEGNKEGGASGEREEKKEEEEEESKENSKMIPQSQLDSIKKPFVSMPIQSDKRPKEKISLKVEEQNAQVGPISSMELEHSKGELNSHRSIIHVPNPQFYSSGIKQDFKEEGDSTFKDRQSSISPSQKKRQAFDYSKCPKAPNPRNQKNSSLNKQGIKVPQTEPMVYNPSSLVINTIIRPNIPVYPQKEQQEKSKLKRTSTTKQKIKKKKNE